MQIRVCFSRQTVKALYRRLQDTYEQDDVRLVRRISVLLEHVVDGQSMAQVRARWGVSMTTIYNWLRAYIVQGLASLVYRRAGGRS